MNAPLAFTQRLQVSTSFALVLLISWFFISWFLISGGGLLLLIGPGGLPEQLGLTGFAVPTLRMRHAALTADGRSRMWRGGYGKAHKRLSACR